MNPQPNPRNPRGAAPKGATPPKLPRKRSRKGRFVFFLALMLLTVWGVNTLLRRSTDRFERGWGPRWGEDIRRAPQEQRPAPEWTQPARTPRAPRPEPEEVAGPRAAPPSASTPGGIYSRSVTVELSAAAAGATIRFTLDGSEPAAGSREYSGPLTFDDTTLLKAKSFEPGLAPSVTVARTYTLLDSNLDGFTSNLPLVIINAFDQPITKPESIDASLTVIDPGQGRSELPGTSHFEGRCQIKLRGYSSLRFPKRSFSVKTCDDSGRPIDTSILGFPADSDWVLYAPYPDKTLMRDVLAYELSNKMGRWAARTRFVEVFLNRQANKLAKRDYMGVYVFEEKVKRAKHRVNIHKLTKDDDSEPEITGGYLIERDHTTPPMDGGFAYDIERGFRTGRGMHLFYVDPKESEITSAQKKWLTQYLNRFEKALYGSNFKDPDEGYAKYLDVDSFIDQFWIVEMSKNIDGFRYSCYMFKDRGDKLRLEPIWDWNLSFGNANYHQGWMTDNWYWRLLRENEVSWYRRLSQDPEFMQRVIDRWTELRATFFAPDYLAGRIDAMAAELEEAQARNFQRWPILGEHVHPNWFVGGSFEEEVKWMKRWIRERVEWIDNQFVSPPVVSRKRGEAIDMSADHGTIFFTTDGSDPRLAGGEASSKAREFEEPVTLHSGTRIIARVRSDSRWSGPVVLSPRGASARAR
ncbi:MAG: CotH kinase family protein [Verrucomicrobiia bacterium]